MSSAIQQSGKDRAVGDNEKSMVARGGRKG